MAHSLTHADLRDGMVISLHGHRVKITNVRTITLTSVNYPARDVVRFEAFGADSPLPGGYEGGTYGAILECPVWVED